MRKALTQETLRSVLIAAAVAALVAFLGLQLAEGEPPPPRARPVPDSSPQPVWTPNPFHPDETPAPSPTLGPASVVINGQEVPLAAGFTYSERAVADPAPGEPGTLRLFEYERIPGHSGASQLSLDEEGRIVSSHILPEDMPLFQELLDAALPQLVTINEHEVNLPPGATISGAIVECPPSEEFTTEAGRCPVGLQIVRRGDSFVSFDHLGVIAVHVSPEDEPDFQPVLDALE